MPNGAAQLMEELKNKFTALTYNQTAEARKVLAQMFILHKTADRPDFKPDSADLENKAEELLSDRNYRNAVFTENSINRIRNSVEKNKPGLDAELSRLAKLDDAYRKPADYGNLFDSRYTGDDREKMRADFVKFAQVNKAVLFVAPDKAVPDDRLYEAFMEAGKELHETALECLPAIEQREKNVREANLGGKTESYLQRSYFFNLGNSDQIESRVKHEKAEAFMKNDTAEGLNYQREFIAEMINRMLALPDEGISQPAGTKESYKFYAENADALNMLFEVENMFGGKDLTGGVRNDFDVPENVVKTLEHKKKILSLTGVDSAIKASASENYRVSDLLDGLDAEEIGNIMSNAVNQGSAFALPLEFMGDVQSKLLASQGAVAGKTQLDLPDKKYDGVVLKPEDMKIRKTPVEYENIMAALDSSVDKSFIRSSQQFRTMKATLTALPKAMEMCRNDKQRADVYEAALKTAREYLEYKRPAGSDMSKFNDYEKARIGFAEKVVEHCNSKISNYTVGKKVETLVVDDAVNKLAAALGDEKQLDRMTETPAMFKNNLKTLVKMSEEYPDNLKLQTVTSAAAEQLAKKAAGRMGNGEWEKVGQQDAKIMFGDELKYFDNLKAAIDAPDSLQVKNAEKAKQTGIGGFTF